MFDNKCSTCAHANCTRCHYKRHFHWLPLDTQQVAMMVKKLPCAFRDISKQHTNGKTNRDLAKTINIPVHPMFNEWKVHGTTTNHTWTGFHAFRSVWSNKGYKYDPKRTTYTMKYGARCIMILLYFSVNRTWGFTLKETYSRGYRRI